MAALRHLSSALVAALMLALSAPPDSATGQLTNRSAETLAGPSTRDGGASGGALPPNLGRLRAGTFRLTPLEKRTGLVATIDSVNPASLQPGKPLQVTGTVTNQGKQLWTHGQAYLTVASYPATSKAELDQFASQRQGFGTRIFAYGLFDEIGPLKQGTTTPFHLSIPYGKLPITMDAGVYHVGVEILGSNRDGRDYNADATADTFVPLVPPVSAHLPPTHVLTLVPLTAPVLQQVDGSYLDNSLGRTLAPGGRLRNVIEFADAAPADSLTLAVDPAVWKAAQDMANGYLVRGLRASAAGVAGHPGNSVAAARAWLLDLRTALRRQHVVVLPWGAPDASSIADRPMPALLDAAVAASRTFAAHHGLPGYVVGWQSGGLTNRHALVLMNAAGATVEIASQTSVLGLAADPYPPPVITALSRGGPLTTVVTRNTVAGRVFGARTTVLQLRQDLLSEATIRSLSGGTSTSVIAAPFDWNPGPDATGTDVRSAYLSPVVSGVEALGQIRNSTVSYPGQIKPPSSTAALPTELLDAARRLRIAGRVLTELVANDAPARNTFDQQLAMAGSAAWRFEPKRGEALIRQRAAVKLNHLAKVTVTTPTFVALSSQSGKFPLTVTNGMHTSVTVRITLHPRNPALVIEPVPPLVLRPGEQRDIQVVSHSSGSGLTQVRVRLMTRSGHSFGTAASFDVRATQIGVAIWVVMGLGALVLLTASARRIYLRVRTHSLKPREEPSP